MSQYSYIIIKPRATVCSRVHSLCCTSYGFWQMYSDMWLSLQCHREEVHCPNKPLCSTSSSGKAFSSVLVWVPCWSYQMFTESFTVLQTVTKSWLLRINNNLRISTPLFSDVGKKGADWCRCSDFPRMKIVGSFTMVPT